MISASISIRQRPALKEIIKKLKARTVEPAHEDERAVSGSPEMATSLAQSTPTLAAANATQTAPKPNPILVRLPEAFVILAQIFDPSESGPKAYSITSNGRSCTALKKRLRQFYGAGPFVETSPRIWGLDPHFGSPKLVVDPAFLKNLHFSW